MKTTVVALSVVAFVVAITGATVGAKKPEPYDIIFLVENSAILAPGIYPNAEAEIMAIVGHIEKLGKRRATRKFNLHVIPTTRASVAWTGGASSVKTRSAQLQAVLKPQSGLCNDLLGSFRATEATVRGIEQTGKSSAVWIVAYLPGFHLSDQPCNPDATLSRNQLPPHWDYQRLYRSPLITHVVVLGVYSDQKSLWFETLNPEIRDDGTSPYFEMANKDESALTYERGISWTRRD